MRRSQNIEADIKLMNWNLYAYVLKNFIKLKTYKLFLKSQFVTNSILTREHHDSVDFEIKLFLTDKDMFQYHSDMIKSSAKGLPEDSLVRCYTLSSLCCYECAKIEVCAH